MNTKQSNVEPIKGLSSREIVEAVRLGELSPTRAEASIEYLIQHTVDLALAEQRRQIIKQQPAIAS